MQNKYRRLIESQPKVKVVARTKDNRADQIKFSLLAAIFAGFFYFFGTNLWYALVGG